MLNVIKKLAVGTVTVLILPLFLLFTLVGLGKLYDKLLELNFNLDPQMLGLGLIGLFTLIILLVFCYVIGDLIINKINGEL